VPNNTANQLNTSCPDTPLVNKQTNNGVITNKHSIKCVNTENIMTFDLVAWSLANLSVQSLPILEINIANGKHTKHNKME
jgi:hypothetical protein